METCKSLSIFSADFLEGSLLNDELMLIGSFCKDLRYFSTSCQAGVAVISHAFPLYQLCMWAEQWIST